MKFGETKVAVVRVMAWSAVIIMAASSVTAAEPRPIELFTPPGMERVDGRDAYLDDGFRNRSSVDFRHLAYYSQPEAWEKFVSGRSPATIPELFAYTATPRPLESRYLSEEDFIKAKAVALTAVLRSETGRILGQNSRLVTFTNTVTGIGRDLQSLEGEIISTVILVDGRLLMLYTINYAGPDGHEFMVDSHQGWLEQYVNNTAPGHRGGKTDQQ